MLDRGLRWAGVDPRQWRSLTRATLQMDFRTPSLLTAHADGNIAAPLVVYTLTGIVFALIFWHVSDRFTGATLILTAGMFMVTTAVLVEYHAVVVAPTDYAVLAHLPVSSRTYFAVRLTNLFCYTGAIALTIGLPPATLAFLTDRSHPLEAVSLLTAFVMAGLAVTLAAATCYAALLTMVHPAKVRRLLSYAQVALSLAIPAAYLLGGRLIRTGALQSLRFDSPAVFWDPAAWFAAYIPLAMGRANAVHAVAAVGSLVFVGGAAWLAVSRLSLDYASRLAEAEQAAEAIAPSTPGRVPQPWIRHEARVVLLLLRGHFRQDLKFRLSILSILPVIGLYLLLAFTDRPVVDPFDRAHASASDWYLLCLALVSTPLMLPPMLARSDAYRASWVLHATPADRSALVMAAKNAVVGLVLLPCLTLVGSVLAVAFRHPWHALVHTLVLGLVGHLGLQVASSVIVELPFSRPVRKAETPARYFALSFAAAVVTGVLQPALIALIYPSAGITAAVVAGLVLANVLGEVALRRHVAARLASAEYEY